MRWRRRPSWRWVHPSRNRITKFFPNDPPTKGDVVLVDGQRCRVLKSSLEWDGLTWTITEPGVCVRAEPLDD